MWLRQGGLRASLKRAQRGVALIALMVLIVLGIAGLLVSALNASTNRTAVDRTDNAEALAKAKAALIGWMATNAVEAGERNPGRLPCPEAPAHIGDPEQEGKAAGSCTLPKIGRLPWRTLGLPKLLDTAGEPLWYVVSPGWAYTSDPLNINSDSVGNLTVDGQANAAVALVIAPGGPVVTSGSAACSARVQQRGAMPPDFCNYLETALDLTVNPAAMPLPKPTFTTFGSAGAFNDHLLKITAADLIPALEAAVATRMQRDLAKLLADAAAAMPAATAAAPVYPFAADWPSNLGNAIYGGTIVPATGTGLPQGLLPIPIRSRKACKSTVTDPTNPLYCSTSLERTLESKACVVGADEHCDPASAISWAVGSSGYAVSPIGTGWKVTWADGSTLEIDLASGYTGPGRIGGVSCATSAPANISCAIHYGIACASPPCAATLDPVGVRLKARTGKNAGIVFRRVNPAVLDSSTFRPTGASTSISLGADGEAVVSTEWLLPGKSPCPNESCESRTVEVPSLYIEDNVPLQAHLHDELPGEPRLRWIFTNGWHKLVYFAVSPARVPGGGALKCEPADSADCLSVGGAEAALAAQQALLVIAGRALPGIARGVPPAGYLENSNADANLLGFERRTADKSFNDRIVFLNPRP